MHSVKTIRKPTACRLQRQHTETEQFKPATDGTDWPTTQYKSEDVCTVSFLIADTKEVINAYVFIKAVLRYLLALELSLEFLYTKNI